MPENIQIHRYPNANFGDNLWILFNYINQALGFNSDTNQWIVASQLEGYCKAKCKLTPCKREDLKAGDTAVIYQKNIPNPDLTMISRYYKVLPNDKYAKVDGESISAVTIEGKYLFFKVEPIQ